MKITYKDLLKIANTYAENYGEDVCNLYFGDNFVYGIKGDILLKRIANGLYGKHITEITIENSEDNLSVMIIGTRDDGVKKEIAHHDYI